MKNKKIVIISIVMIAILAILFVPIPTGQMKDGGTKTYSALTYKIVKWHRLIEPTETDDNPIYENVAIYWFPDNMKTYEELWEIEINR